MIKAGIQVFDLGYQDLENGIICEGIYETIEGKHGKPIRFTHIKFDDVVYGDIDVSFHFDENYPAYIGAILLDDVNALMFSVIEDDTIAGGISPIVGTYELPEATTETIGGVLKMDEISEPGETFELADVIAWMSLLKEKMIAAGIMEGEE